MKIKKRWYLIIVPILVFFWYGQKRNFYCLDGDKCITVWKTYNNTCYIIPGKYYGVIKPQDNYILTTNLNDVTIYFVDKMSDSIFVRCEKDYTIYNVNKSKFNIIDYYKNTNRNESIIYSKNHTKFSDVNMNVNYINLFIQELYATDKNGDIIN
jgi:hypothetical protein